MKRARYAYVVAALLASEGAHAAVVRLELGLSEPTSLTEYERELHPTVPARMTRVLIPVGQDVASVRFLPGEIHEQDFTTRIKAQEQPLTLGKIIDRDVPAYDGGLYPKQWTGEARVVHFRGYSIVTVPVFPLRITGPGRAIAVDHGVLEIETTQRLDYSDDRRTNARDLIYAQHDVDNNPQTDVGIITPDEEIGYLIIGPRALIGSRGSSPLDPLIAHKERRHLIVELAALEDVAPSKTPEAIRAFIKQRYQAKQVDYVLLVGDKGNLPWKYVKSGVRDESDPVPSDQYYACLDGDFSDPKRLDWACEVSVGRIGVKSQQDIRNWVKKTLSLHNAVMEQRTLKVLNFAEKLDERTLGQRVIDLLINGATTAPSTTGFPHSIQWTKLYDTFEQTISGTKFIETVNGGDFHVVNHLGHANKTYVFRTNASQLRDLEGRPAFYYSQGCYPNDPDVDNWTVQAVRMADYGPAAMIANTRFGWYEPGSGEGTSSKLHRAFWSTRFQNGLRKVGDMNHKAKELVVAADDEAHMIYTALESNLIGDPELDLGIK